MLRMMRMRTRKMRTMKMMASPRRARTMRPLETTPWRMMQCTARKSILYPGQLRDRLRTQMREKVLLKRMTMADSASKMMRRARVNYLVMRTMMMRSWTRLLTFT